MLFLSVISTVVILSNLYTFYSADNMIPLSLCYHLSQLVLPGRETKIIINHEFENYQKRPFTKFVESSGFFHHLQDEKQMMSATFRNWFINYTSCSTSNEILSFFLSNRMLLFKRCTDFREFSHCQQYYLFQYDTTDKQCHSYFHENYIKKDFTGVTMILALSPSRLDRLPLHLQRWKGPMSISIQLNEEELEETAMIINAINRKNIRFTFYVVKKLQNPSKNNYHCSFISMNRKVVYYDSCFVINELRNLAIETILTTHYMLIDGDAIISKTLEEDVKELTSILSQEKEILLIPLFPLYSPSQVDCIETGNCTEAWNVLPQTKSELLKNEASIQEIKGGHKIIEYQEWRTINENNVIEMMLPKTMEPYDEIKNTH